MTMSIGGNASIRRAACGRADLAALGALLFALTACSAAETKAPVRGGPTPGAAGGGAANPPLPAASGGATSGAPGAPGSGPTILNNPTMPPAGAAGTAASDVGKSAEDCASTSTTAPPAQSPAVDIIWLVDASGSMLDEQIKVGANLTTFADRITQSAIDVHIVMMTTSAAIPVICPVTAPDPLAGTALASDPRYRFIESRVDSNNPLDVAISNYPQYSSFLRPGAKTHFVIVTDDESSYKGLNTPDERASSFLTDMKGLLGHDFILHTISSEGPVPCSDPNCMPDPNTGICVFVMLGCGAAAPGTTYYSLADQTAGLKASICQSDWKSIFEPLSEAVIASAPLPCNYQIPTPPSGESLDPSKVNVGWASPTMGEMLFGRATDGNACGDQLGWYYDKPDQPAEILLCPKTCEAIAAGGTLNIGFGCETVELK